MKIHNRWLWQSVLGALAIFAGVSLGGCESAGYRRQVYQPTQSTEEKNIVIEESLEQEEEILPGILSGGCGTRASGKIAGTPYGTGIYGQ